MKKLICLAAAAVLLASMCILASCGGSKDDLSDSKYVGTWKCTELSLLEESGELSDEWVIKLNPDGTGTTEGYGDDGELTWKPTDDGFKTKGDVKLTFKDDGDNVKASLLGIELIFEKQ